MRDMRGLTLVVASGDRERFRTALTMACAHAALGARTRVYCHEDAVSLLAAKADADAEARATHGLPDSISLIAMALESDVELISCQTGLALSGLAHADLPEGIVAGGLLSLFADLGDDRLVAI